MADNTKRAPDVARYAHQLPDGTILYFESDGRRAQDGELAPNVGHAPSDLERAGYTFLDYDAYEQARRALDPIERGDAKDADDLAEAFDMSMGSAGGGDTDILQNLLDQKTAEQAKQPQAGVQQDVALTPEMMAILQEKLENGTLADLFQPFQQEQSVLDQQMQLGQGMREQRGPQRSTPTGALFSGLSGALGSLGGAMLQKKGLDGQAALGKRMQGDASGRVGAILKEAMRRKGMDPTTGLMAPAVDDATLASIISGG